MLRAHFLLIILLIPTLSFGASSQCMELFANSSELGLLEPVPQMFRWEHLYNLARFRKPTEMIRLLYSLESKEGTEVLKTEIVPASIDIFERNDAILWPKHPLNTETKVPHSQSAVNGFLPAFYSASRSLFVFSGDDLYSVKTPTNRPSPNDEPQPIKAELGDGPALSVLRSQDIYETDLQLGESPYLKILLDVAAYTDKNSQNGFTVRDLRPLQDGNYYLPAFSIPYVGEEIAARFKDQGDFKEFWATYYAAAIGRAKAELFLRYGLVANSPNAQNTLVQLDKNFLPTGKIYLRDITDTRYHESAAFALGYGSKARRDHNAGTPLMTVLQIKTNVSFWKMRTAGVETETISYWEQKHDDAFVAHIVTELGLNPQNYRSLPAIQMYFNTDGGLATLSAYAAKRSNSSP